MSEAEVVQRPRGGHREHQMPAGHEGHEAMHANMLLLLFFFIVFSQFGLHYWKSKYPRSFHMTTLVGVVFIPLYWVFTQGNWRFFVVWLAYLGSNAYVLFLATRPKLAPTTPRFVYRFFLNMYRASYGVAFVGFILFLLDFLIGKILHALPLFPAIMHEGIFAIFYGLYFGLVNRDLAELTTHAVHTGMGYGGGNDMPTRKVDPNMCSICGRLLFMSNLRYRAAAEEQGEVQEPTVELPECHHFFHEYCILGWVIIGKRETCPVCREKMDTVALIGSLKNSDALSIDPTAALPRPGTPAADALGMDSAGPGLNLPGNVTDKTGGIVFPWQSAGMVWGRLLDMVRYLVVWNPVIFFVAQLASRAIGWY